MLRLLPLLEAPGASQMATDEALLGSALVPTLRLYTWSPATVSLGYFQDYASIARQLPPGMPVVRRITGGGAIWHEHEVTYALIGVLGEAGLPARTRDLYPLVHGAIREALARRGAPLIAQVETVGDRRYSEEPRCFASPAADDLVHADGGKSLGSAARARRGRVLLHGSLKLASNPWDDAAVAACGLSAGDAAAALIEGLCSALAQSAIEGNLTTTELSERDRLSHERYATDDWVKLRQGPRA